MADDEQFSLCWNNFNSNLSAGFHESLCRGDLVDVTLAAEGQLVKAHRLVLSVCSPYFRKMFTQMPANQHAFVFLKDVSHTALKDLIQFMYCGEVNVKQEALPAFISTAEALQIKGLTDSDPPQSQTPPEPSTPTPQIQQQIQSSPRVRQRTSTARSYKIETVDDSGDEAKQQTTQIVIQTTAPQHPPQATITTQPQQHQQQQQQHHQTQHTIAQQQQQQPIHTQTHQLTSISMPTATTTVVSQKRPAQRTSISSATHIKRSKSTIDPLDAAEATVATHQINVQTTVVPDNKQQPQVQQQHQQQTHHHQQQQQQQQQQQTNEPEYIDLPIELPTKSEPDYAEDTGEVDQAEQDAHYVEDESYGDMRYDENYFTENEDAAAAGGNTTAGSTQNTSATAAATTSKAIVKQLSDSSYMDTSGDPANSDAQGKLKVSQSTIPLKEAPAATTERAAIKPRGRPRKDIIRPKPIPKLFNKIIEAVNNNPGQPLFYGSTTKGTMKLVLDGHHFRYSFRKGKYTIFQCCYKENKEECTVRVVTDQKLVYPLDGEHIHFVAATDKSVTSIKFTPGEDQESENLVEQTQQQTQPQHVIDDSVPVFIEEAIPQPMTTNVKLETITSQDALEFTTEVPRTVSVEAQPGAADDANEFREKIKKRLQKALLGKKKQ